MYWKKDFCYNSFLIHMPQNAFMGYVITVGAQLLNFFLGSSYMLCRIYGVTLFLRNRSFFKVNECVIYEQTHGKSVTEPHVFLSLSSLSFSKAIASLLTSVLIFLVSVYFLNFLLLWLFTEAVDDGVLW